MSMEKRLCLFAGTTEGRLLAERLSANGAAADVFVATEYGKEEIRAGGAVNVSAGRLSLEEMERLFLEKRYDLVLDATHPYARLVSENIKAACLRTGTPSLRVLRKSGSTQGEAVVFAETLQEAVEFLKGTEGKILTTTGSKELKAFLALPNWEERVFARVLSLPEVVEECGRLGFYGNRLIAMQGPFSKEMNLALLHSTGASWLVTKESGPAGGFEEKAEAAREAGVGLVVIGRPKEEGVSFEDAFSSLEELLDLRLRGPRRKLFLVGAGPGDPNLLTRRAEAVLRQCQVLLGARRNVQAFSFLGKPSAEEYKPEKILDFLREHPEYETAAVILSGDTGFYSGASQLLKRFKEEDEFCVFTEPGISSMSYFFSKIGASFEDAAFLSLHGRDADLVGTIRRKKKTFLLLGGKNSLSDVCGRLLAAGLEDVILTVGENLSLPEETFYKGRPEELKDRELSPLSVVLIENASFREELFIPGLPDTEFLRGEVPMTKMEVRAVSIAKLRLCPGAVVCDVGAGTGSVSIECARLSDSIQVYAVEREEKALELLRRNKERFGLSNLEISAGSAPEILSKLPPATHVFIGGSGGKMEEIVREVLRRSPSARFVANLITIESLAAAERLLHSGLVEDGEIVQISAARSRKAGASHLMMGQNPVWIASFCGSQIERGEGGGESNDL